MPPAELSSRRPARSARETWLDRILIALALTLLLSGFRSVIEGTDWWVTTVLLVGLTGLTCAVLRTVGIRWVTPIALAVELILIGWIFVPSTLVAIVPAPDTFRALGQLLSAARDIIVVEQAPVASAKAVVLVVATSFGLIVIVADVLLERRFAVHAIGILLVAVFVTPALISGSTPSAWLFVAVATTWLVLLRSRTTSGGDTVRRRTMPALVLGAASLGVALIFPALSPNISAVAASWGSPPPTVFGRGINPILELGKNLRRNSPVVALTYTTGLSQAPYLKVATLRDFTGKTWKPGSSDRFDVQEGQFGIASRIPAEPALTTITIRKLKSDLLPVPYPTDKVSGLEGKWSRQNFGLTWRSDSATTTDQKYTATSAEVEPTAEQMRSLDARLALSQQANIELPADMSEIIGATARKVTADADNDYDRMLALQSYFRSTGGFAYSESAPVADDYDGNGVDVIAEFLKKKSGYCVHFSSAMAVMARSIAIPARIAVGYAPGSVTAQKNGQNVYEVTSDDLHAWTEVYFEGAGWTRFEPTPSIGTATSFAEPDTGSTPTDTGESRQDADTSARPEKQGLDSVAPVAAPSASPTAPRTMLITGAGLIVLGGAPALLRVGRRRWRIRRGRVSIEPLWLELEDTARDHGIGFSTADTPRGFASRLRQHRDVDEASLQALLVRVETSRFSRDRAQEGDGVADLRSVVASMQAGAPRLKRLRATFLPRSLAGRRTYAVRVAEPVELRT